jgi:hypothetical protein
MSIADGVCRTEEEMKSVAYRNLGEDEVKILPKRCGLIQCVTTGLQYLAKSRLLASS